MFLHYLLFVIEIDGDAIKTKNAKRNFNRYTNKMEAKRFGVCERERKCFVRFKMFAPQKTYELNLEFHFQLAFGFDGDGKVFSAIIFNTFFSAMRFHFIPL